MACDALGVTQRRWRTTRVQTPQHTAVAVCLSSAVRAPLRLLLAESDCLLLVADAPSTSAEGGDVCSVRTGLYHAVVVKRYFVHHPGVQKIGTLHKCRYLEPT